MKMDCLQFRRSLLEDPFRNEADLLQHEDECRSCTDYARKVRADETRLRAALQVSAPPELSERIRLAASLDRSRRVRRRHAWWLSAAAGVLIAVSVVSSELWLPQPDRSGIELAQSVLHHINDEAHHLHDVGPVRTAKVKYLFRQLGAELNAELGPVNFAAICLMRRKTGVHLVFSGERGPVTVFFMPSESAASPVPVKSPRFEGRILPTAWGSIAVVGERGEVLDGFAERMRDAVHWPTETAPATPLRS